LQHAHDLKLIHRDVKPDNILSGPNGQVWLSDFGIVSIAHSSRSLNMQDGGGTIHYMAPEQILGKPRLASDQYALGIIAYEWICGSRPFNGTAIEIAMQHSQAQPPLLGEQVPSLAPAIEHVVLRALAKDPKDRFASVREFAEALAAAVEHSKPRAVSQKTKEQWFDEGFAFRNAGRYKEAIGAYNRAIKLDPGYATAYYNRGNTYFELKEYARAIEDYNRAIELNPTDADAYNNRGNAYKALKEYARAVEDYNCTIEELDPKYVNAYAGRGLTYYYLNDYYRAIQDFDYALQLDPSLTWFQSTREDAYRKLGKKL
jgi:tetratricopeptide (TPR) repeat protein